MRLYCKCFKLRASPAHGSPGLRVSYHQVSSQVLLNEVPGKSLKCKRGVRQRDHLLPLLFVLAADMLHLVVNKAYTQDLLKHPLSRDYGQDYPIVQYANDTLIIVPTYACQLFILKGLLRSLTCLKVNYSKSFLVPINIDNEKAGQNYWMLCGFNAIHIFGVASRDH
jgi:hypothetical protein